MIIETEKRKELNRDPFQHQNQTVRLVEAKEGVPDNNLCVLNLQK